MTDVSPHIETNGGLANIYPSHYERELTYALQQSQRKITTLEGKVKRLQSQVKEFRQKCDPKEEYVLVTAEEMTI